MKAGLVILRCHLNQKYEMGKHISTLSNHVILIFIHSNVSVEHFCD